MTVQNTTAKVREDGNGIKSVFSFPFKLFSASDLEVSTIVKSTGVATVKVLNTDYTVSINQITEGGTVTYLTTVPSALEEFFAKRVVPDTQPTDIPNVGSIRESQIETPLDRRTMVSQQQQEQLNRAVLLSSSSIITGITIEDPEEGKGLFWVGNVLTNTTDDLNDIVADATAQAVLAAASAAAAATSETNAATSETNAATSAAAAAASATAAATSATNAAASATAAATSATNAATSETNAATSAAAAAASAAQLSGTSTTSVLIGNGSKSFVTQADKFFDAGTFLLITSDANPATDFMIGQVTSYVGTALTVLVTDTGGSGTLADWTIRVSGSPGQDGVGATFLSLPDTFNSFAGLALFKLRVNAAQTAIEAVIDAGSPSTVVLDVNQTTHGFSVGNVLKVTGVNTFALAQADSAANAEVAGIVAAVTDVNNFTIQVDGQIVGLSGLTAGQVFFLSPSVAGALTSTEPTGVGEISKHLLIADSVTTGFLLNFLGQPAVDLNEKNRKAVTKSSHGFVVGDILRHNGTDYVKAQADTEANAEVLGIVDIVVDADNFVILSHGFINTLSGLSTGNKYFLSEITAGVFTLVEPTGAGEVSKPLFFAISATEAWFFNFKGEVLGGTAGGGSASFPAGGGWNDLKVEQTTVATVTVTADGLLLTDASEVTTLIQAVSEVMDITVSGVNGLDTGAEAAGVWYYIYIIRKSSDGTVDGLLSLSPTSPTLPAGYDQVALVSAVFNDGSSNFRDFIQYDHDYEYKDPWPIIASGDSGSLTVWSSVDTTDHVPNGISEHWKGQLFHNDNGFYVTNDSGVVINIGTTVDLSSGYGVFAPSNVNPIINPEFHILTADTIFFISNDANSNAKTRGFILTKV